jgi:hypothetical protein
VSETAAIALQRVWGHVSTCAGQREDAERALLAAELAADASVEALRDEVRTLRAAEERAKATAWRFERRCGATAWRPLPEATVMLESGRVVLIRPTRWERPRGADGRDDRRITPVEVADLTAALDDFEESWLDGELDQDAP